MSAVLEPASQQEVLTMASEFGRVLVIYLAYLVGGLILGISAKNLAMEYITLWKMKLTEFQGTRVGDLVNISGEIFKVKVLTRERVMLENVEDEDDQIHMPSGKYWNGMIRSKGCEKALKDCKQRSRNCK